MSTVAPALYDKVGVVTGASSGLGEAIALMMAQRGAHLTLCGRDQERLHSTLSRCVEVSGGHIERFLAVTGDVVDATTRADIVKQTVDKFGRIDVYVANAGVTVPNAGILTATEATWDTIMGVNLKSVFFQIQEALPHLEKVKGNIVVISSMTTHMACSPNLIYPISKAAIDHMVRCLAVDLGPRNIRVNAVNPSFIPTRIRRQFGTDEESIHKDAMDLLQAEVEKQPLGSEGVSREAVAEAVSFLASTAASFITGQCLLVDGGRCLTGPMANQAKDP